MATNFVADVKNWKERRRNQHGGKHYITETQSVGIHDVLFGKGLQSIVGRLQTCKFLDGRESFLGKAKGWIGAIRLFLF